MECLFCRIAQKDIAADIVFEDQDVIAFRDRYPQAPTHILVIPKRHITTLNDATASDATLLGQMIMTAQHVAKQEALADAGYRLVFNVNQHGGQTIYHIHLHVLGGRPMTWPPG
jgi:histidine triad (HIT) family protein